MSEPKPTLYDIIGVPPTATLEEIKRAYRKRAMELHPDRNQDDPDATAKFQQLSEAYEILKDPAMRERYDKFGSTTDEPTNPDDAEMLETIMQIMGLGRSRGMPKGDKVSPSYRILKIPLSRAYTGGVVHESYKFNTVCPICHGTGSNDGKEYPICPTCNGAGSLSPGGLQFLFPCEACDSVGYLCPRECRCYNCLGRKLVRQRKSFDVKIEIGCDDQDDIVIPSAGDEYPGKETADLHLIVQIKPSSNWARDGDDLYYLKNLSIYEQKHGTAFTIHHLDGRELEVYTQPEVPPDLSRIKWIPNEGMPCRGNVQFKGNLYIYFEKGFPEPIHEGIRTLKHFFNVKFGSKIFLQDAPDEKQKEYQEHLQRLQEEREEAMRQAKEAWDQLVHGNKQNPDQKPDDNNQGQQPQQTIQ
ncbi:DnaJ domain containing protein [Trichomonas vaginalis G3]|uniref:DnaJ domain containing protein n=1 Tax=Trichomonas vaginalis (strain ATCC PRA-98 / G3) TaxID=412133 RepID=A2FFJ7_TRIV3|nr:heat shock protein binding [Trichomonas vaginalis G3]EAX96327.1 DnaJ domain containing protein [Trichomonas vaginalis G3]KAI5496370.1 heat shock protein binding [Trichomonas vaginalis G3]|eukprot:XP_001309257.1 DnaJ domain containing protein [Trichomonas vaginalis G3]